MASWSERKDWAHKEHDIFALGHTRAKNRAIADLVGGGEVTAEEVLASEAPGESKITETTTTSSTSRSASPQTSRETWTSSVPITKDPIVREGVKQDPLIQGTASVGMINVLADGSEASIVPEHPIPVDAGPVQGFLIPRVLDAMKEKHPGFGYRLDVDRDGMLQAILIRGRLDEAQIKELGAAAKWTFMRALEKQPQPA